MYLFPRIAMAKYYRHFLYSFIYPQAFIYFFIMWLSWVILHWIWECRDLLEILISIPSGLYSKVGLLDHMVIYFKFFEEPLYCFPQWLHQFSFPWIVYQGLLFPILSPTFVIFRFFFNIFLQVWGDISLWFWFALPWWLVTWSTSSYLFRFSAYT